MHPESNLAIKIHLYQCIDQGRIQDFRQGGGGGGGGGCCPLSANSTSGGVLSAFGQFYERGGGQGFWTKEGVVNPKTP